MSKKYKNKPVDLKPSLFSELKKALLNDSTKGFVLSVCGLGLFLIASLPQANSGAVDSRSAEKNQLYTGTVMDEFDNGSREMKYVNPYIGYYQRFFCRGNRIAFGCDESPLSPITATLEANGQDVRAMNRAYAEAYLEQGDRTYRDPYFVQRERKYTKSYTVDSISQ
jgi:hypothetical protein